MGSCKLYHGPNAKRMALFNSGKSEFICEIGDGDNPIGVTEARKLSSLSEIVHPGGLRTVVMGPMDMATQQACDSILKVVEESSGVTINVNLWSFDIDDTPDTIKSRCFHEWCPGDETVDELVSEEVSMIIGSILDGGFQVLYRSLSKMKEWGDPHIKCIPGCIYYYMESNDNKCRKRANILWDDLRKKMVDSKTLTYLEVVSSLSEVCYES